MSKNLEMDEPRPSIGSMLSDLNLPSSNSNPSNTSLQKRLTPIGQVEQDLEYIFTPVNPFYGESGGFVPSRGWSDDLCYGTGTAYVSGLAFGGAWGFLQGLSVPLDIPSNKLRINAILNAMSRRGPFVANSFGVLAILYNALNSSLTAQFGKEYSSPISIAAASSAGLLYKSSGGFKAAGTSGLICASIAILWQGLKQMRLTLPTLHSMTTKSYS